MSLESTREADGILMDALKKACELTGAKSIKIKYKKFDVKPGETFGITCDMESTYTYGKKGKKDV